jgi:hypothetical protein
MPSPVSAVHDRAFLFFSVDIADSVLYKTRHINEWATDFIDFFDAFPKNVSTMGNNVTLGYGPERCLPPPLCWKFAGDEILFYIDVADAHAHSQPNESLKLYELALYYAVVFTSAIRQYNSDAYRKLAENHRAFLLKGTAWFAAVAETRVPNDESPNIAFWAPEQDIGNSQRIDFIGRQMDIGFRIAKHATANRFVVSVEYAILLLRDNYITVEDLGIGLYFDGRKPIKGMLENIGYPIIYSDLGDRFEHAEQEVEDKRLSPANAVSLMRYLQEYIKISGGIIRYPVIKGDIFFDG